MPPIRDIDHDVLRVVDLPAMPGLRGDDLVQRQTVSCKVEQPKGPPTP